MNPGKEFDEWIFRNVMKYTRTVEDEARREVYQAQLDSGELSENQALLKKGMLNGWGNSQTGDVKTYIPDYTTNKVAAWDLIDALHATGNYLIEIKAVRPINHPTLIEWDCFIFSGDGKSTLASAEFQETMPLAVCNAVRKVFERK